MRSAARTCALLPALVGAAFALHADPHEETARTHTVTVENMQFSPASLTVSPGDRIVWVNQDLFPHTATADSKAFDSRDIAAGASWTYVAVRSGEYAYSCTFHPTMKGRLVVR